MDRAANASDETALSLAVMPATSSRRTHYTYEDYLRIEDESLIRHEYFDGEIYAMSGGTPEHAALAASLLLIIGRQLPGRCRVFTSDLRVRTPTGLTTYPDGTVVCHGIQRALDDRLAVTNPVVLMEVTSNSTEENDRGVKLRHYQSMSSVRETLIVSHRGPRISLHRRTDESGWTTLEAVAGESVTLESIGVPVRVDDLYRDAQLEDAAPQS